MRLVCMEALSDVAAAVRRRPPPSGAAANCCQLLGNCRPCIPASDEEVKVKEG